MLQYTLPCTAFHLLPLRVPNSVQVNVKRHTSHVFFAPVNVKRDTSHVSFAVNVYCQPYVNSYQLIPTLPKPSPKTQHTSLPRIRLKLQSVPSHQQSQSCIAGSPSQQPRGWTACLQRRLHHLLSTQFTPFCHQRHLSLCHQRARESNQIVITSCVFLLILVCILFILCSGEGVCYCTCISMYCTPPSPNTTSSVTPWVYDISLGPVLYSCPSHCT